MNAIAELRTQLKATGALHERLLILHDQIRDLEDWLGEQDQDAAGIRGALDLVDGARSMIREQVRELNKAIESVYRKLDDALGDN